MKVFYDIEIEFSGLLDKERDKIINEAKKRGYNVIGFERATLEVRTNRFRFKYRSIR
jgi:hypothetical protein